MLAAVNLDPTSAELCPPALFALVMVGYTTMAMEASHCCQMAVIVSGLSKSVVTDIFEPESQTEGTQFAAI